MSKLKEKLHNKLNGNVLNYSRVKSNVIALKIIGLNDRITPRLYPAIMVNKNIS